MCLCVFQSENAEQKAKELSLELIQIQEEVGKFCICLSGCVSIKYPHSYVFPHF